MEDFGSALHKNATELTVMDVYDIAAVVGQEFERIIDQYGCEALSRLMPKVVRVLEVLEVLVSRSNIHPETEELRRELDRLRLERNERLEKEKKHQKELEQVEDVWRGEAQDLLSQITQLQAENSSLLISLAHKDSPATQEDIQKQEGMSARERQVMKKLRDVVDKQRDEIRAKDHELTLKSEDIDALQMQQHRLMKINQDLRHRIGVVEAHGKAVIQQRAELEAQAQGRQQELGALQEQLARLRLEHRDWELERTPVERGRPSPPPPRQPGVRPPTETPTTEALLEESEEDPEGPDRPESDTPRITLQELQDVLQERNELKAQVFLMQEELAYYKSEDVEEEVGSFLLVPSPPPQAAAADQPESGIKRLIFTAIMPMVAAGLIQDDPTLLPIRRLMSFV